MVQDNRSLLLIMEEKIQKIETVAWDAYHCREEHRIEAFVGNMKYKRALFKRINDLYFDKIATKVWMIKDVYHKLYDSGAYTNINELSVAVDEIISVTWPINAEWIERAHMNSKWKIFRNPFRKISRKIKEIFK